MRAETPADPTRCGLRFTVLALGLGMLAVPASATPTASKIEAYFKPFADTNNLSGSVLITRGNTTLFAQSYGYSDRSKRIPNRLNTRYHIASLSILFTSTAVLRLIDQGALSFDTRVSEIVSGVPNGDKITVRNLLMQNSNLPDSNDDLPNYDDLLESHQTPQSLIDAIKGLPSHGEPGGKSQREEHSGQNLLALIVERKTGLPFAQAMQRLVFEPFGMRDSGIDDDSPIEGSVARGYQVSGSFGLVPASKIHWSAKTGNGSAYSTVNDEWKWLRGVLHGDLLSNASRDFMLGTDEGFGWWKTPSERLGQSVYQSSGRGPGFSSFFEYLPNDDVAVFLLTNIENEAGPEIVREAAWMIMGKSYEGFKYSPVPLEVAGRPSGDFTFGADFYRKNGTLRLVSDVSGVRLIWPNRATPLLPLAKDKFKDRYYWIDVAVTRGPDGDPVGLEYGKFHGTRSSLSSVK